MNTRMQSSFQAGQRGVVLFIALIMLVAMTLAGLGLVRSVSGGVMLAGNLSLKSMTTRAADYTTEFAGNWIAANQTLLAQPTAAYLTAGAVKTGYSAVMDGDPGELTVATRDAQGRFDPLRMPATFWDNNARTFTNATSGFPAAFRGDWKLQYVIHRMCESPGAAIDCVQVPGARNACTVDPRLCASGQTILYRVSMRLTGPKNTESFVQVMIF